MTGPVTLILLALTVSAWIVADVWLYYRRDPWTREIGGYKATISYFALTSAQARPIVAAAIGLAIGILLGHLFWPQ